jgi:endo-1,4-beta-xylanase
MKFKNIIPLFGLLSLLIVSCDDDKMDWHKDPTHGEITNADLPLGLAEKISRYDFLKNYTDFKLGAGIGVDLYLNDTVYHRIVNENFDEVAAGYEMKHAAMVNAQGVLNFTSADAFVAKTKEAGLTVYGHTLVWHSNQNASYLNSLIAPTIIPGSSGTNLLDLSALKDKTLTGWGAWNDGDGISVVDNEGMVPSTQAVKMIASASSANAWSLQLISPAIIVDTAHTHEISFYIKSDVAGKGRISFAGLKNNYPWKDWYNTGGSNTEAFETTSQWQQVKFTVDGFTGVDPFKISFDLGYLPSVTYYIDVNTISVVDLEAGSGVVNMLANGTFDENISGWSKWNGITDANTWVGSDQAYQGNGAMKVVNDVDHSGSQWKTQIHSDFTASLISGVAYTVSFMIRSEATGSVRCSTTGNAMYQGDQATSTTWKLIEWSITGTGAETGLNFDLGAIAGTYYVDNVVVTNGDSGGSSEPIVIEKTDAEKTQIIGDAMENWISQMVGHYKTDIKAWDVVNEPMLESGDVRDGNVTDLADDDFYWVKYLGKDYAVTAFNLARQYGNSTDILFINDYNLESNLTKCQGLIDYVQYIEGKGAVVDGIGTQMHISISSDTTKIAQMFEKLGATGKYIKVSELDVRLGTNSPTAVQLESQANMYRYVVDMYKKYVPVNKQYGITIWSISDNEKEHEYWLPDESPNLWDANYERKHAYKGFADGLAGKDVSEDFSGELVY